MSADNGFLPGASALLNSKLLNLKDFQGWHANCFDKGMQSEMIAMLMPAGSAGAALLVRRADGQFAFGRIDARVARAAHVAAHLFRKDPDDSDPAASALEGLEKI